ncbi:MAG TPA: hypothetical protein VL326_12460 [Kofleriaceae bacterium]|jgi:hypothetical protein|nr:hypothetical protein [Kofleriaceae bacterium]
MKKYIAASLCMFVVAACAMGGSKKSAMMAPPTATDGGGPAGAQPDMAGMSPKQELDARFAQLEQERQQMQLGEPQVQAGAPAEPLAATAQWSKTDATCKPAPSETCQTSCKLSDSICDNATKICKLSDELQPDDDAAAKCAKSTKTCKTSHEKCCGCML